MSKFKMWKWFKLPVDCELIISGEKSGDNYPDSIRFFGHNVLTGHHVDKIEVAINSYDANQDLITKQAEQIKMLRSVIESAINKIDNLDQDAMGTAHMQGVAPWSIRDEQLHNLSNALEATKPVEE